MLIHECIACQHGLHDRHRDTVTASVPGLIGSGHECPCRGECVERHRPSSGDAGVLAAALASVAHLGRGGNGPWENRTHIVLAAHDADAIHYPVVKAWVNAELSVQLLAHGSHPGIDHLLVRRHDEGIDISWGWLQAVKDRLLPDGQARWAVEVFPPRDAIVDNANLRHLWVMPRGWVAPVDLRDVKT